MLDLFKFFRTKSEISSNTHTLPSIEGIKDLKGKRVLLRASLNAPVENGKVTETFRLEQAVESIEFLKNAGAKVVVIAHIGREKDESLKPVCEALGLLTPIRWGGEISNAGEKVSHLENGEAILLENLRQDLREGTNDESFAKELALLGDLYINDAFSDSHREHTSIIGIPKYLPSYFGFSFIREYDALLKVMEPKHPAVFILGGAKFETKLPLVTRYARIYDRLFIGGALVHDILKARGYEIGKSLVSDVDLTGNPILELENISVPSDVVVTDGVKRREVGIQAVLPEEYIYDAGPKTLKELERLTSDAKTILWNGPLGNFEKGFSFGTETLARMLASSSAYSVVGGGDTIAAIRSLGLQNRFGFLSTAGGAMLVFLEKGTLPAIDAVLHYQK
ncbi:phosphoglycerate kinase [Candidatus Nomurabacteria bacterium]|nr:phosphoglycerate kinase [Candidatus Nomurabacteria bacterium]